MMHTYLFNKYCFKIQAWKEIVSSNINFDQTFKDVFPPVNVFSRLCEDYNWMINQILKFWKT